MRVRPTELYAKGCLECIETCHLIKDEREKREGESEKAQAEQEEGWLDVFCGRVGLFCGGGV